MDTKKIPLFINAKDRLSCLQALLDRLERDRIERIVIIDPSSTWPPMLEFLSKCRHEVVRCQPRMDISPKNVLWDCGILKQCGAEGGFFMYTDCDIVPHKDCPDNWTDRFYGLLERHPKVPKVGFGLKIDDIPKCYRFRQEAINWQRQFWIHRVEKDAFRAVVDTTMAMYRPGAARMATGIRTGGKYIAVHLPWYSDSNNLSEEEKYYIQNLHPLSTMWTRKYRKK
jgi:hypothetical protein